MLSPHRARDYALAAMPTSSAAPAPASLPPRPRYGEQARSRIAQARAPEKSRWALVAAIAAIPFIWAASTVRYLLTLGPSLVLALVRLIRRAVHREKHRSGAAAPQPLVEHVPWVVALADEPERRNLLITQSYHDLSTELARVLGPENVNWCTFATWASRTAGRFVREEEVPKLFRNALADSKHMPPPLCRLHTSL